METFPLLILLIAFGALMFFQSRRQRKAMQATIDLHESLRIGDRVHTSAGLEGIVRGITDDDVELEIAPGVVTRWMKIAIRDRIEPEEPAIDTAEAAGPTEITDTTGSFGPDGDISSNPDRR